MNPIEWREAPSTNAESEKRDSDRFLGARVVNRTGASQGDGFADRERNKKVAMSGPIYGDTAFRAASMKSGAGGLAVAPTSPTPISTRPILESRDGVNVVFRSPAAGAAARYAARTAPNVRYSARCAPGARAGRGRCCRSREVARHGHLRHCLLYTSPSPRDS